jgi:hypothetical protein
MNTFNENYAPEFFDMIEKKKNSLRSKQSFLIVVTDSAFHDSKGVPKFKLSQSVLKSSPKRVMSMELTETLKNIFKKEPKVSKVVAVASSWRRW